MRLGVNIDHVATLRQARDSHYPEPAVAAAFAELAGAEQIVCHLREDRRHIKDRDVNLLREVIEGRLNLEMAATDEMVSIALAVRPHVVTLVPERREERTTEQGLDVAGGQDRLKGHVARLQEAGIPVSLFIDPETDQVRASHRLGVDQVELHTGPYSDAVGAAERRKELARLADAARLAVKLGLEVAAGHGLHYQNVKEVAAISEIQELNIGHSIVCRAILVGMEVAVREMMALMESVR